MNRLEAMSLFAAIADAGSLSAAGRRFGVPLATVSRKLMDLESHLKTRLLTRSTRRLVLTDAGRDYLAACRQILELVDEAERAASGAYANPRGQLVIAAPIVMGRLHVVPVVAAFLEQYDEVDIQLRLGDRNVNLIEEHVDLAVRIGRLPDSGLVAMPLGAIRRVVCASPAYLLRFGTPRLPQDLAAHRCITFDGLDAATAWTFPGPDKIALQAPVHSRLTVSTADAAIAAAIAGVGLTRVLSYQVAEAVRNGLLAVVLTEHEPPSGPASLIYPGQARLPMKTRAFIDFAAGRIRERLSTVDDVAAAASASNAPRRAKKSAPQRARRRPR
jgi:DNA-binding transcriptional LysR family regulator